MQALGIAAETGSLEVGKSADMVAVDLGSLEFMPVYDVVSHLVYVADRHAVTDVWVAGRALLRHRTLTTLDLADVTRETQRWQSRIATFRNKA